MDLNTLWFLLIGVLFTGFFVLEGFDYGVGILLPFLGKTDEERRRIINTIGPVWDGNEVWILTAGGAIFAAFPHWYATLFSGFYLALFLMLVALIVRGVAFEFRSKDENPAWRATVGLGDLRRQRAPGAPLGRGPRQPAEGHPDRRDEDLHRRLLRPASAPTRSSPGSRPSTLFVTHGAIFLNLKSTDPIRSRAVAATQEGRAGGDRAAAPSSRRAPTSGPTSTRASASTPASCRCSRSARSSPPGPSSTASAWAGPSR